MAWADLPAIHVRTQRNEPAPPVRVDVMRPFIQYLLVELEGQRALLCDIGLVQQLVVDTIEFWIFVIAVIRSADRMRLPGLDVDDRVDDAVAIAAGRDLE